MFPDGSDFANYCSNTSMLPFTFMMQGSTSGATPDISTKRIPVLQTKYPSQSRVHPKFADRKPPMRKDHLWSNLSFMEMEITSQSQVGDAPNAHTMPAALTELNPGPWRSLGRVLDYAEWKDRERFLQLDAAIAHRSEANRSQEQVNIAKIRIVDILY